MSVKYSVPVISFFAQREESILRGTTIAFCP